MIFYYIYIDVNIRLQIYKENLEIKRLNFATFIFKITTNTETN